MPNELKPCECGNTELDLFKQNDTEGGFEFVVMCQCCKKYIVKSTAESAIEAWNLHAGDE